jgi:ABC-type uncharacterized transport system permease subunit
MAAKKLDLLRDHWREAARLLGCSTSNFKRHFSLTLFLANDWNLRAYCLNSEARKAS